MKPTLLLHACCGGCAATVIRLLGERYAVSAFFFNPNIHPRREWEFRREEFLRLAKICGCPAIVPPYDLTEWFAVVRGLEQEPERGRRCTACFRLRLERTFVHARDNGFAAVASTLSISPYKSTAQINAEGARLQQEFGIPFLPENFKSHDGHSRGRRLADELGVRRQDTCGCTYSRRDRLLRLRRPQG